MTSVNLMETVSRSADSGFNPAATAEQCIEILTLKLQNELMSASFALNLLQPVVGASPAQRLIAQRLHVSLNHMKSTVERLINNVTLDRPGHLLSKERAVAALVMHLTVASPSLEPHGVEKSTKLDDGTSAFCVTTRPKKTDVLQIAEEGHPSAQASASLQNMFDAALAHDGQKGPEGPDPEARTASTRAGSRHPIVLVSRPEQQIFNPHSPGHYLG